MNLVDALGPVNVYLRGTWGFTQQHYSLNFYVLAE